VHQIIKTPAFKLGFLLFAFSRVLVRIPVRAVLTPPY
jgi:hypothetical protein